VEKLKEMGREIGLYGDIRLKCQTQQKGCGEKGPGLKRAGDIFLVEYRGGGDFASSTVESEISGEASKGGCGGKLPKGEKEALGKR